MNRTYNPQSFLVRKVRQPVIFCCIFLIIISIKPIFKSIKYSYRVHADDRDSALIIDHTCTDISQIPQYWLDQAKQLTIHYAHTSHGSQLTSGAQYMETYIDSVLYSFARRNSTTEGLPPIEAPPALRMYDGNPPETYIAPDDYWDGVTALDRTRVVVATGNYDYSMWSWCGQQSTNSTDTVQRYLDNLNLLGSEFPEADFIYMTGHTDGTQDNPESVLRRNNDMIREYAINNNKVLFDFADIESWDPAGNYYDNTTDGCAWCNDWCSTHPEECMNLPSCAHSHGLNCKLKGQAFWWMMARLAGWDPSSGVTHLLTVSKGGSGSGTVTSSPIGIDCGSDCTENYIEGTHVILSASSNYGSEFLGWTGGGCSGTVDCIVTMSGAITVNAEFGDIDTIQESCIAMGGYWIHGSNECVGIPGSDCSSLGGIYNSCASPCRNNDNSNHCTMFCMQVCSFESQQTQSLSQNTFVENSRIADNECSLKNDDSFQEISMLPTLSINDETESTSHLVNTVERRKTAIFIFWYYLTGRGNSLYDYILL